jgi:hypothetical protein
VAGSSSSHSPPRRDRSCHDAGGAGGLVGRAAAGYSGRDAFAQRLTAAFSLPSAVRPAAPTRRGGCSPAVALSWLITGLPAGGMWHHRVLIVWLRAVIAHWKGRWPGRRIAADCHLRRRASSHGPGRVRPPLQRPSAAPEPAAATSATARRRRRGHCPDRAQAGSRRPDQRVPQGSLTVANSTCPRSRQYVLGPSSERIMSNGPASRAVIEI